MSASITGAIYNEMVRHKITENAAGQSLNCKCGTTVEYSHPQSRSSAFGTHVAQEVWKNVDLPLVESAEALASLSPGSIVINEKGEALSPKKEHPGPDNDEEIFATRGPLRILSGGFDPRQN